MNILYKSNWINYTVFLLLIFTTLQAVAQSDEGKFLPNIVPPSPVAGELGKYGNVPVGLFTGAANISIPLISFKTKDLESPISLFYGSNGIKVDEVASNVGLGWNLNFGGVITRTIRDKDDDAQLMVYPPDDLPNATSQARLQFFQAAGQDNADTEKDIYSFNFSGNSGKFMYDKNGASVFVNNQKIKIERTGTNNADFLLTATNGTKYYFTEKETTAFRNQGSGHSVISASVTAWYLSKIVNLNGSEISFAYDNTDMDYTASNSQTLSLSYPPVQNGCGTSIYSKAPVLSGIVANNMTVLGKKIKKIYSNNTTDGYIALTYYSSGVNEEVGGNSKIETIVQYDANGLIIEKISFNYSKTANARVFLQNLTYLDPEKRYSFEYFNQPNFPARLSNSQDHWGYYNGKSNTNLVPKNINDYALGINEISYNGADKEPDGNFAKTGMLSKIIYPTKGYTEFDYESNTYWGEQTAYPVRTINTYVREPEDTDDIETIYTITSPISQKIEMSGIVTYVRDGAPLPVGQSDPYDTGNYMASVQIFCVNAPSNCPSFYTYSQFGDKFYYLQGYRYIKKESNTFYFDAEAGKTYEFHFFKGGLRAKATLSVKYYSIAPVITNTNLVTGGVRIKSTRDFSNLGSTPGYKRYYYASKDDLNRSSGDKGKMPLYLDLATQRNMCQPGDGQLGTACSYVDNTDLVVSSSSIISLFDTGSSNCFYKYVTTSEGGDNFENGGEMKEFLIRRDAAGALVLGQSDIKSAPLTNFGWDNGLELKSQIFQKKTGTSFTIVAENENKYKLDPSYASEIKSYSVRKDFNEPCPIAGTINNFSMVEYKTKSYWFYLESSVSKKYDLKGLNPIETVTNYVYNNPAHIQLTSQSTKSSLQESLETKFYYPQDLSSEPLTTDMIAKNMLDIQLKTEVYRAGVKQSEQKTVYAKDATTGNILLPKFIYAAKSPGSLEKKITYDKYDDKGNILQYTLENGTPVAIIWGYNQTKPIAKIENSTYDQAFAVYSANDTTFRNNLPNAMITTYTYKPLVGVSTVTDPKGFTTYYEYDAFNRLKVVKDNLGNILSENQYHYKN